MATNGGYSNPAIQQRPARNVWQAIKSGFLGRCPHCDSGRLFGAFMKPVDQCANCGEEMHHHRSDDLPPYLVIFVVGHIVVGGYLIAERMAPVPLGACHGGNGSLADATDQGCRHWSAMGQLHAWVQW